MHCGIASKIDESSKKTGLLKGCKSYTLESRHLLTFSPDPTVTLALLTACGCSQALGGSGLAVYWRNKPIAPEPLEPIIDAIAA